MKINHFVNKLTEIFKRKDHPMWVFIQQFAVRGLLGMKFLLIARFLNPTEVGLISIALITLTLVEALTEIGIMQAIVQSKKEVEHRAVVWSLQFFRGVFITVLLLVINPVLLQVFDEPKAMNMLIIIAFVPLIKNTISVNYYYELRKRNFRDVSIIFCISSVIDLFISIILIFIFKQPIYAVIGLIIGEAVKVILSHFIFGKTLSLDFRFNLIKDVISYGKWIWSNSVASFFTTQFDKILASNFLGTQALGLYQMSQKMTQLMVADISFAAGQYLFPQYSYLFRNKNITYLKGFYSQTLITIIGFAFSLSGFVIMFTKEIITIVLGNQWLNMEHIIQLMMISSSLAAIMNISVIYNRAIGYPRKVAIISYVQLVVFVISCLIMIQIYSVLGLIFSSLGSYLLSIFLLNFKFKRKIKYFITTVKENIIVVFAPIILIIIMILSRIILPTAYAFLISLCLLITNFIYLYLKFKKYGGKL